MPTLEELLFSANQPGRPERRSPMAVPALDDRIFGANQVGPPAPGGQPPSIDIWNGNQGTRSFASGAPAQALDSMRGMGGTDPGYLPFAGGGEVRTATPGSNANRQQLELIQALTDKARNNLPGGNANPAWAAMQGDITQRAGATMQNQLGQNQFGLNQMMQLGQVAPNGVMIPGAIANNASDAVVRRQVASNSPRAEDVQADNAAMREYNNRLALGMTHETAISDMRRLGIPLARQHGGGARPPGSATTMPWETQTPTQSVSGTASGNANISAGMGAPPNVPAAANDVVANAFSSARSNLPTIPGQVGQNGVIGPAIPEPFSSTNAARYHRAITDVLRSIPEDQLRSNFPAIQQRLINEFGGPQALDSWINTSNGPGSNGAQNTQIDRLLRMSGGRRSPVNLWNTDSENAPFFQRLMGSTPIGIGSNLIANMFRR